MESVIIKIILCITNAIIIPIFIPILNWLLRKDEYTSDITLIRDSNGNTVKIPKSNKISAFIEELPTAYFANLVSIVVYMYSEHFRVPFLIIYYILTVYCILLIIFTKKDFSHKSKTIFVSVIGILLLIFTFIVAIGPYIKVKSKAPITLENPEVSIIKERNTFFISKDNQ